MLSGLPHHTTLLQLATHMLALYATIGLMAVGFAIMLGGTSKAGPTARFFFMRPMQRLVAGMQSIVGLILSTIRAALVKGIALVHGAILTEFRELAADLRWLVGSGR